MIQNSYVERPVHTRLVVRNLVDIPLAKANRLIIITYGNLNRKQETAYAALLI